MKPKNNQSIANVVEGQNGELMLELNEDIMRETGWKIGDTLQWKQGDDNTWKIERLDTEWVLVETVSMFRQRYMVEVPVGKAEWALDTVTMNDAEEFSQKHLDETIVSHRVISRDDALKLCRADNDYIETWSDEHVERTFFTPYESDQTSTIEPIERE